MTADAICIACGADCNRTRPVPSYSGLEAPEGVREVVERVHGMFAMRCPLYRTLHTAIAFTASYELVAASV